MIERFPYPAKPEDIEQLKVMPPRHVTRNGALLEGCISYHQGQPLFLEACRIADTIWLRLATVAEFKGISTGEETP